MSDETTQDTRPESEQEGELSTLRAERDDARATVERLESELAEERARHRAVREAVQDLAAVVEANASGDLTRSPEEPDVESLSPLYEAYDDLLDSWRDTVDRMSSFSEQVTVATGQVDDRLDSVRGSSREVSGAVDDISAGAERQNEWIQDISDEMRELSATIEEIAATANNVAETSSDAATRGTAAQESARAAVDELETLTDRAQETVTNVEQLQDLLDDIEDIVAFITDVADQTNILALNANIEAARAGEEGSGFAVVASEVKSLATETKEATDEIRSSIERVQAQADTTVDEMHRTRTSVEETRDAVDTAIDELDSVVEHVTDVDRSIQEIDDVTDAQATSTQEVVSMVDQIGEISDRTVEEATVAAEAAEAQTTELADVSTRVSTIADRATTLETTLEGFDLPTGEATADHDATVVEFWHAMGGEKAVLLEELAREFEAHSDGIRISLTARGDYRGTLEAALRAGRQGSPPAITQIFEIGSTRARESGYFLPVDNLLEREHLDSLLDPVTSYYRFDGRLHSLPFNASNPLLFYNRDAFEQAGLDPDRPPETFAEIVEAAERLDAHGPTEYGITFANYSWFVEQWFAEADELLVDAENGRAGRPTTSNLDGSFGQSLFEWWAALEANGLYHDPGMEARGAAKAAFHDGDAAMLIGSTSSIQSIEAGAAFPVEVGCFPVLEDRTGVLVGGGSLWVGKDCSNAVHSAVAEFLSWLTEPEQQQRWHRETGYFPVHEDAIPKLRSEGWFAENPHYETAFTQLVETEETMATRGAQIEQFDTVRTIVEEGFASMDAPDDVASELERVDARIESVLGDGQTDR